MINNSNQEEKNLNNEELNYISTIDNNENNNLIVKFK